MPNCFQLHRDGAAVSFLIVDEEMCRHFDAACHPTRYFEGWYDTIGYGLAAGDSFDQIRSTYADFPILVRVADWIEANFTPVRWYETRSHPRETP